MSDSHRYEDQAIGQSLREARARLGMEVAEAEERTKIRAKYLRALENEDWDVLPGSAYIRGFLRTYGGILGLDGEVLADRFRRYHEEPAPGVIVPSEPVLTERRRGAGGGPPGRGVLIGAIVLALVAVLLVLGLTGGDDDDRPGDRGKKEAKSDKGPGKDKGKGKESNKPEELQPIDITVEALSPSQVCLVGGSDTALIDTQVLPEGASEDYSGEKKYRIDMEGGGKIRVEAGDASEKLEATEPVSLEADSSGIREIDYAGPDCP